MRRFLFLFFLVSLVLYPIKGRTSSYKKVLKKWTRSDTVYRLADFEAEILWNATYLNDPVLAAQADQYAKQYHIDSNERGNFLGELYQKQEGLVCFFVSFYSHDRRFDDLLNPAGHWDIRLEREGEIIRPKRIEKMKRPTPLEELFYPYLTPWSTGYHVWFPIEKSKLLFPFVLAVYNPQSGSKLKFDSSQ